MGNDLRNLKSKQQGGVKGSQKDRPEHWHRFRWHPSVGHIAVTMRDYTLGQETGFSEKTGKDKLLSPLIFGLQNLIRTPHEIIVSKQ